MDKLVDAYYKKILILLAVDGGSWVYGVKFYEKGIYWLSIILFVLFSFLGLIIVKNYVEMNKILKRMKNDENYS